MADTVNKAFMLDLSYRLTVAVNMAAHKDDVESFSWRNSWHGDLLSRAKDWQIYFAESPDINGNIGFTAFRIIGEIVDRLSRGHQNLVGPHELTRNDDVATYSEMRRRIHEISFAPCFGELELSAYYVLGQQLAHNDLRACFDSMNDSTLLVFVGDAYKFTSLSGDSFPLFWPSWPRDQVFNGILSRYIVNQSNLDHPESFSAGPLLSLGLSILCPSRFPSTIWCWEDWEGDRPWHLFLAGQIFPSPVYLLVKDRNDKAFVVLLETMATDKKAGRTTDDCGWVTRDKMWPDKKGDARKKAWAKMKRTLSALGDFESRGSVGKDKDTGAPGRVPAALARPDCGIIIEKSK